MHSTSILLTKTACFSQTHWRFIFIFLLQVQIIDIFKWYQLKTWSIIPNAWNKIDIGPYASQKRNFVSIAMKMV